MESTYEKIKSYIFPAKKVLDSAGKMGTPAQQPAQSTDTSYIQGIVKQRMEEKMKPKNPLADMMSKTKPKTSGHARKKY
ncbi:hypothetical protein UFOVP434_41 [uncultured Caudovirales phage]|uniref:Uncharacterized protein n=1 Tax=uncultured Caudovirales phage TaxID=2100421 RepID=A0A6J5M9C6_9CAUD|nr:hypothetical protein UFOVP434_41 [uncultured Caudovirales phage]